MYIHFITGRPGTGKTARCLQMIKERLDGDAPLYYLIPEQYSLQAEKLLLTLDRRVITRVQAISFNRLAYRLFARLGGPPGKLLDDVGKGLLLRKILFECGDALLFYKHAADKQGFIDGLAQTVTEFNTHTVSPEELRDRMPESGPALQAKLHDLALITEKYREAVRARFLTTDDMLDVLCQRLDEENPLAGSYFWVDGFYGFTPQEYRVLARIAQAAAQTVFALTLWDGAASPGLDTLDALTRLSSHSPQGERAAPIVERLQTDHRHAHSPALAHFAAHFQPARAAAPFAGPQNAATVSITHAADKYACVYEAARQVWAWVTEKGGRFRDVAILCGDRPGYDKLVQTAFDRCRIPLFADTVTGILAHPLTELIRASFDIVITDWSYPAVFRFLKTRLAGLSVDEVDKVENYALAHGIKSYRWRYPFKDAPAEDARRKVLAALSGLEKLRAASQDTVLGFCRGLFAMLARLRVAETLAAESDAELAQLHRQVWGKVCEVTDKLAEMLGDENVTLKAFARMLDAGLGQVSLGRIPPTVDQVFLGDIDRSRFPQVKLLIVLGANDHALPDVPRGEGLFTDRERLALRRTDLPLAPDCARAWDERLFALRCALCQPADALAFIYAESEPGGGKPLRPAPLLARVLEMFPGVTEKAAPAFSEYGARPSPPRPLALSPETARALYGPKVVTAASRLERFAACPFAYYVTYNLQARERRVYQVRHTDLGVLFHEVLARFSLGLAETGGDWGALTREETDALAARYVEEALPDEGHVLKSTARNRHIMQKAKRVCAASLWALCEHVKRGAFTPAAAEMAFAPGSPMTALEVRLANERRLVLTGRIDRVDVYHAPDGARYVKIIDYKSGRKKFDLSEVLLGTQLQLILYMNALLENAGPLFGPDAVHVEARPGGVFYFHIDDPVLAEDAPLTDAEKELRLLKAFRMSGLALAEETAVVGMDHALAGGGDSLIIPVTINKDGAFGKASSVRDAAGFAQLGAQVQDLIAELGARMTDGDVAASPQGGACDFCRYGGICGV